MTPEEIAKLASVGAGPIIGMATAGWNDRRQLAQQGKLQRQQIAGQMEMGKFNQALALDMWEKTNYAAQRKQLEKAGLNVGLLYGMSGGGGTTANAGAGGNVTGANAPSGGGEIGMGMSQIMQMEMLAAQIRNTDADTKAKLAGIPKTQAETGGILQGIEESKQRIQKLIQETTNETLKGILIQYQTENQKIINNQLNESFPETLKLLKANADKTTAEAKKAGIQADNEQKVIDSQLAVQAVSIAAAKSGIKLNEATIKKIGAEINNMTETQMQNWAKLDKEQQKIELQKQGVDFTTSTANQIHQWLSMVTEIVNAIKGTPAVPFHSQ